MLAALAELLADQGRKDEARATIKEALSGLGQGPRRPPPREADGVAALYQSLAGTAERSRRHGVRRRSAPAGDGVGFVTTGAAGRAAG